MIRKAEMKDLNRLSEIEMSAYTDGAGASKESIQKRLMVFPNCFWIMEDDRNQILGFVNGMATHRKDLIDQMYDEPSMHCDNGEWLMLFSVVVDPKQQKKGYATTLLNQVLLDTKQQGKKGVVLTCKEELLSFYSSFGFVNEGISSSEHADIVWYQMRLVY